MKVKQTLTKENFWDGMTVRFPKAMKLFCQWIDDYKAAVEWETLFNHCGLVYIADARGNKTTTIERPAPKFHEIPYAMQQGIWIEFAKDLFNRFGVGSDYDYLMDLAEDVQETFVQIEPHLNGSE
jgi:hypothetical protein